MFHAGRILQKNMYDCLFFTEKIPKVRLAEVILSLEFI
jgi:hypothetical protein